MKSNCLRAMAMGSALGLVFVASPALSATYSVVNKIEGGTCASSSSVTGSVVETCDTTIVGPNGQREVFDLVGRSEAGNLGIEASLTLDATASTSAQQNTFGSVNAVFDDTLTFGVESGVFRLAVDIDGTQTASVNPVSGALRPRRNSWHS